MTLLWTYGVTVLVVSLAQLISCSEKPPPCFSDIYCHGELLHTVQMAKLFDDSKTFVDMKLKQPPNITMANFRDFMRKHDHDPSAYAVEEFVHTNFDPAGQEFTAWDPADWIPKPKFVEKIKDQDFRRWGSYLNGVWKDLGRKMKDEVKQNQELYSIIWVPNPVIVPGGRFREFYYWDSYWIVQGLLLSGMYNTTRGMLENFAYIVDNYGHIPNGGRIYYLERSQPPFLVPMVKLYFDATEDLDFIRRKIKSLDKEFDYWMTSHTKTVHYKGKNYTLAVYGDNSKGPRPESYSEDIEAAELFDNEQKKEDFYAELKAAAESGWDFSSRWFIMNKTNNGTLINTKTRSIVPVDLNAFIYWNAVLLKEFHEMLGNDDMAMYYDNKAKAWLEAVTAVLWDEETHVWFDFDLINSIRRKYFYPTNIAPLLTGCYPKENIDKIIVSVMNYLENKIIYDGGIPTTLEQTGEQWDFPNAWPPLQHMVIVGLNNTGDAYAQRLAKQIAKTWLISNYHAYNETEAMYEKYDATKFGGGGGGGEYEVQLGFGWTNGIIIHLLNEYGDQITKDTVLTDNITHGSTIFTPVNAAPTSAGFDRATTIIVTLVLSLVIGYIGILIYRRRGSVTQVIWKNDNKPSRSHYTELKNIRQTKSTR